MNSNNNVDKQNLSKSTLWLMTIGAGLVVANNYYSQPLLGMIARDIGASEEATSRIFMITQIGYAIGLLLILPLSDMFNRKRIILTNFGFVILSLLAFSFGKSLMVLLITGFLIGLTSVVPQIFVPIAAQLSKPEDRTKNVGMVMSGLLIGILASRVFSGIVAEHFGWRVVYYIAAIIIFILGLAIAKRLPVIQPTFKGTYKELMGSIFHYVKTIPSLRLASIRGAFGLGSFSVFWTILTFRLEQPPFMQGSEVAGLLSLFGIAGALCTSFIGYIPASVSKNTIITIASLLMIISWVIFGIAGATYIGLIIGIILLDMGLQSVHVCNQSIVFSSHPEASNRLNTIYMVSYFIGGSLGTLIGGKVWGIYGWIGVVIAGILFVLGGLISHLIFSGKKKYQAKAS